MQKITKENNTNSQTKTNARKLIIATPNLILISASESLCLDPYQ